MVSEKDIKDIKRRAGITESNRLHATRQQIKQASDAVDQAFRALRSTHRVLKSAYAGEGFDTELDEINAAVDALSNVDAALYGLDNNLPE